MRILSFDTSSFELHLSLLEDRAPVLERVMTPDSAERQEVASQIMPEIDRALRDAGWDKKSLNAVVVGVGPGSFTGIRIAVITARTICQILQLPLAGVSLLEAYASTFPTESAAVILASTSNQFFYASYGKPTIQPKCGNAVAVQSDLSGLHTWFGDEKSVAAFPDRVQPLPKLKNIGTSQAQLAFDRLSLNGFSTETFAWQKVLPLYLRNPSVTIKTNYAAPNPAHESR